MPETPDFESIARKLVVRYVPIGAIPGAAANALIRDVAEQLRLAWNARGAADITKVEATLYADGTSRTGFDKMLDQALRSLDR